MGRVIRISKLRPDLRDELGISARLSNLLARRGIRTVEALLERTWADVESIRGLGLFLAAELDDALSARGLWLDRGPRLHARLHQATDDERAASIASLGLDGCTLAALATGGVATVGDLVDRTLADLHRLPGVGSVMTDEVRLALAKRGLHLAAYVRHRGPPAPVLGDGCTTLDALAEHGFIGTRAYIRLDSIGATTVQRIAGLTAEELLAVEGLGSGTLAQIRYALRRLGFHLRGEAPRSRPRKPPP